MKISLKSKIIHTLDFHANDYDSMRGIVGLNQLMQSVYSMPEPAILLETVQGNYSIGLNNIFPDALSEWDYKAINGIKDRGGFYLADLRTILQDLVNKEHLPPGDYQIKI